MAARGRKNASQVYFALNLEHFSFGEGLGAELFVRGGPQPDVLNFAWRDYGQSRSAPGNLHDAFDTVKFPMARLW